MTKRSLLPMNLQFFAEGGTDDNPNPTPNAGNEPQDEPKGDDNKGDDNKPNYDEIFTKLDAILERRSEGIAKSALKDNGIEESEIKEIVAQYRANKASKAQEQDSTIQSLRAENEQLKQSIIQTKIETVAHSKALELGVDQKSLGYVTKLADFSNVIGEDGDVKADAIVEAIKTVLDDVPALKATKQVTGGFVNIGGKGSNSDDGSKANDALRRAFGLK